MATVTPRAALQWDYAPAPESRDAASLRDSYDLFIDGAFVAPTDGTRVETINPATEEPLAAVAFAGAGRRGRGGRGGARRRAPSGRRCRRWSAASTCSGSRG